MKIRSLLGRIAPTQEGAWKDYEVHPQGEQNSKRWIIEIEYKPEADILPHADRVNSKWLADLKFNLLEYRTGRPIPDRGLLNPSVTPLTIFAAESRIYFPELSGSQFRLCVLPPHDSGRIAVRVTVDAVHSLMR